MVKPPANAPAPPSPARISTAISRDLVVGMGGELIAESTEGVGSTFTLVLPRAQ